MLSKKKKIINTELYDFFYPSFREEKEQKREKRKLFSFLGFLLCCSIAGILLALPSIFIVNAGVTLASPIVTTWKNLPDNLDNISISEKSIMYDKNGNIFATIWTENRTSVHTINDISPYAVQALISTEDQHFYEHKGVDFTGIARAALTGVGGGSGITQQLVKNLQFYNSSASEESKEKATERSLFRKMKELKLALGFEKTHSKDEILVQYFNTVAFGSPNVYGIESASQYFFGKPAKDLSLAESALLVGTVQNPVSYDMNKDINKEKWVKRQHHVLKRMLSTQSITQEEYNNALSENINLTRQQKVGVCAESSYPFYCQHVLDELRNNPRLGSTPEERNAIISRGGLKIYTHLDPDATNIAQQYVDSAYGRTNRVVAPIAAVEPGSGALRIMVVNRGYGTGEGETLYDVPSNPTGSGSSYKMITLATALENGFDEDSLAFSSRCPLIDKNYDTPHGGIKNSLGCGGKQSGFLDYKHATAYSSNTWFAELLIKTGVNKVKEMSRKLGLSAPDSITSRSLSYTLGVTENSPVSMAAAYATFANNGIYCPPVSVRDVVYMDDTPLAVPDDYNPAQHSCRRVMSPHTASIVLKAMRSNTSGEIPDAFGAGNYIHGHDSGAKSGTNQLFNVAWAQVTGQYSMFTNVYDMDKLTRGIETVYYKGRAVPWYNNVAEDTGVNVLNSILAGQKNIPLNFDSQDKTTKEAPVSEKGFVTVPNLIGVEAGKALTILESRGLQGKVSRQREDTNNESYGSSIVLKQSIEPGTQLSVSTKKEIILTIRE